MRISSRCSLGSAIAAIGPLSSEGGIVGGRLYLAAYALRFGATGLTFLDDEVTEFFSPHAEGKSVMFLTALGRTVRRSPAPRSTQTV